MMNLLDMKRLLPLVLFCFILSNVKAQNIADDLWTKSIHLKSASIDVLQRESKPARFDLYQLNLPLLKEKLKNAPHRSDSFSRSDVIVSFPNNEGELENFQVMEASVVEPELQEKYPDIRSYIGKGVDHPGSIIRFSVTPLGLNCLQLSNNASDVMIDPYTKDRLNYMVYAQKDLPVLSRSLENDIVDSGLYKNSNILKSTKTAGTSPNDGKLRTFRMALASSGEYSQYILTSQGIPEDAADEVKKATVLAALNSIMTRVNAIYERDLCLTMKLVANNPEIIFLDPQTDGYGHYQDNVFLLVDNQKNCDQLIGIENYDIGHVLFYEPYGSGGGLANVGSVCTSLKAWGYSIMNNRIYVILHEIGHQFGASHTYNTNSSDITKESVEPGSGLTIMSYGEENEANYFFHSVSTQAIWNNINAVSGQCAVLSETGNVAPIADAGNDLTIPKSTTFLLEGQGDDAEDNSSLTYGWEQTDAERTSYPPVSFASAGPVFKWTPPSSSSVRYMPNMGIIISGSLTSETEAVPSVVRVLNFNFVVRDNDLRGGQIAIDKKVVTIDGNSGPFLITSHKTPETWYSGSTQAITWDVASTNSGAVNVQFVDILFSTDGGYTYPTKLASNVPNDGIQDIVIPFDIKTTTGRYMVRAVGNIFFAINSSDLTIDESPFLTNFSNKSIDLCLPESSITLEFAYNSYLGYSGSTSFSANGPEGTNVTFNPTSANTNGTLIKMTVTGITTADLGKNTITITGTSVENPLIVSLENVLLNVFNTSIPTITLLSPSNVSVNVSPPYVLEWNAVTNAKTYTVELATDEEFANIIESATLSTNSYDPSSLTINTEYYWRVKSNNPCRNGLYSGIYSFKTIELSMFTYIPDDNFQQALKDRGYDTDNVDHYVRTSNIKNIWKLDVSNSNISDLTGIQDFTSLFILECYGNHLKNLNLSKNTALWSLDCSGNELTNLNITNCTNLLSLKCSQNELTSLDVSTNTSLYGLYCSINKLAILDVTKNPNLGDLWCDQNQLTSLDVSNNIFLKVLSFGNNYLNRIDISKNIALNELYCSNNQLSSLDVSSYTSLTRLVCSNNQLTSLNVKNGNNSNFISFSSVSNPNLTCIEVDNAVWSSANWTQKDPQASYSENCNGDDDADLVINRLDKCPNTIVGEWVDADGCAVSQKTYIPDNNFEQALIDLGYDDVLDDYVITPTIRAITSLSMENKNISNLTGIKDFASLTALSCNNNLLTTLDLSNNTALETLDCNQNQLTSLDVSGNTALLNISCSMNNLTFLDVTNNPNLIGLRCDQNQLTSLDVSKNTQLRTLSCGDNNLNSLYISKNIALNSLFCTRNQLTVLDVTKNNELIDLRCQSNKLSLLDVTLNIKLNRLYLDYNSLTVLDVSKNIALNDLSCGINKLSIIDVSNNIALNSINCYDNQLSSLDISNNVNLISVSCDINQISRLDLTKNINLTTLTASRTNLTSLDLTNNTKLVFLICNESQLIYLNLKNGTNSGIVEMNVGGNPNLACIQVDNESLSYSYPNWHKDATASYSEDCTTFVQVPTIASITPSTSCKGETITITGTNLLGTTELIFGGTPAASFTIDSSTSISAVVGDGTSGNISITTDGGIATLPGFEFISLPVGAGIISGSTTVNQKQNSLIYSVPAIDNASLYTWTLPNGATGTSATNTISVSYGHDAVSGDIKVKGNNSCGDGLESTLAISVGSVMDQDLPFITGWNLISTNVVPTNLDLKTIFQPLIDAGKLKKVMDENGKTIENFGGFGGWINNIGNLISTEGFKVNVTAASTLSLEGTPISLPFDIQLNTGWNIISYPSSTTQDAKAVFQSLIEAGKLKKVMDENGKTIEDFGNFGGWRNSIGNLLPCKGYKVSVSENCVLTIPATLLKTAVILPEVLASTHFAKVFSGNGTDHMNIYLVNLQNSGLLPGDEIGVFDGQYCVGSVQIGTEQLAEGNINIPASGDDGLSQTVNGFRHGNPIALQLFREGQTYSLNMEKVGGNELFEMNASLFAKVSTSNLTVLTMTDDATLFKCYPNPFTREITIEVQNFTQADIMVEIYNMTGQLIKGLFKGNNQKHLLLKWNGTNDTGQKVAPGVYLCKVNGMVKQVIFEGGKTK